MITTLTDFLGPLRKTILLYRFDFLNKVNPHKYIDRHPHIVLIVKTIYGKYMAAYSKEEFNPGGCKQGFGMLISIWNRNVY